MKASELFCRMWDAPYQHGASYSYFDGAEEANVEV